MTKPKRPEDLQKRGRKPIEIDYDMAEKYSSIMCTQSEIASLLGVSLSTLEHDPEFLRIHKKGMDKGKSSLRRMQYLAASNGNATMLIWLGKQYLGQNDKQEVTGLMGIQFIDNVPKDATKPDSTAENVDEEIY
jgi:hypothetical protein